MAEAAWEEHGTGCRRPIARHMTHGCQQQGELLCCAMLCPCCAGAHYGRIVSGKPPFEEVALLLVESGEPEALQVFLQTKLQARIAPHKATYSCPCAFCTAQHSAWLSCTPTSLASFLTSIQPATKPTDLLLSVVLLLCCCAAAVLLCCCCDTVVLRCWVPVTRRSQPWWLPG